MTVITDNKGNILAEEPDKLEDWRQAAEVEAGLRREFQLELAEARQLLKTGLGELQQELAAARQLLRNGLAIVDSGGTPSEVYWNAVREFFWDSIRAMK